VTFVFLYVNILKISTSAYTLNSPLLLQAHIQKTVAATAAAKN